MKKSIAAKTILLPTPVLIVASYDKFGTPNAMNVAWGGIVCSEPPCVGISVREHRKTYENIMEKKAFTINIPSQKYLKEADSFGIHSGKNVDKFKVTKLTPIKAEFVDAPSIEEFPITLECSLVSSHKLGTHTQFIGEIKDVKIQADLLNAKGFPETEKINAFLFAPGTASYHAIGNYLAQAYTVGKQLEN